MTGTVARILGIDVGTVRIGTALSDPFGRFASPLEVIWRRQVDPMLRLATLVREHAVQTLVVGHPLRLDGTQGPAAQQVQRFAAALQQLCAQPVVLWDERLSTAEAERMLVAHHVRRATRRQKIDKVAAALILQSYLDAQAARDGTARFGDDA